MKSIQFEGIEITLTPAVDKEIVVIERVPPKGDASTPTAPKQDKKENKGSADGVTADDIFKAQRNVDTEIENPEDYQSGGDEDAGDEQKPPDVVQNVTNAPKEDEPDSGEGPAGGGGDSEDDEGEESSQAGDSGGSSDSSGKPDSSPDPSNEPKSAPDPSDRPNNKTSSEQGDENDEAEGSDSSNESDDDGGDGQGSNGSEEVPNKPNKSDKKDGSSWANDEPDPDDFEDDEDGSSSDYDEDDSDDDLSDLYNNDGIDDEDGGEGSGNSDDDFEDFDDSEEFGGDSGSGEQSGNSFSKGSSGESSDVDSEPGKQGPSGSEPEYSRRFQDILDEISQNQSESTKQQQEADDEKIKNDEQKQKGGRTNEQGWKMDDAAKRELQKTVNRAIAEVEKQKREDNTKEVESDEFQDAADVLSDNMGLSRLSPMFKGGDVSDWKQKLRIIVDLALGIIAKFDPNRINKKITDAPPGMENEEPEFKNIIIAIDCSGSMGIDQFRKAVRQLMALFKARKMRGVKFHIFPWGTDSLEETLKNYVRVKGDRQVLPQLLTMKEKPWGTLIGPVLALMTKKVKNPDMIIMLTDGEIYDSESSPLYIKGKSYIKKHKNKVIWIFPGVRSGHARRSIQKLDPTYQSKKRFVEVKK